jgi:hypothetical protein
VLRPQPDRRPGFRHSDGLWRLRISGTRGRGPRTAQCREPVVARAGAQPYLAATWDAITSAKHMRAASEKTPHSRYVELAATHFVPLQFPNRVLAGCRSCQVTGCVWDIAARRVLAFGVDRGFVCAVCCWECRAPTLMYATSTVGGSSGVVRAAVKAKGRVPS